MAGKYTFIAVPDEVADELVLKRFLDKLVEQLDIAFGNRGRQGESFVDSGALLSETSSLGQIIDKVNKIPDLYVTKVEGEFTGPPKLMKNIRIFRSNDLVSKRFMLSETTKNAKQPAIGNVVAGADESASIVNNRNKINEILVALRASKIISV